MHLAYRRFCWLAPLAILVPAPAAAQSGEWTVTPFALFAASRDDPGPNRFPGLGLGMAYRASRHLSLEVEVSRLFGTGLEPGLFDSWSMTNASANSIVILPAFRLRPYATVGAGVQRNTVVLVSQVITDPALRDALIALGLAPAADRLETSWTRFLVNVGGGAEYALSERVLARADVRRVLPRQQVQDYMAGVWPGSDLDSCAIVISGGQSAHALGVLDEGRSRKNQDLTPLSTRRTAHELERYPRPA